MLLDGNVHNELQGPPKIIHGLENENRNIWFLPILKKKNLWHDKLNDYYEAVRDR